MQREAAFKRHETGCLERGCHYVECGGKWDADGFERETDYLPFTSRLRIWEVEVRFVVLTTLVELRSLRTEVLRRCTD